MAKGDPHHIVDVFKETGVQVPKKNQKAALRDAAEYIKEQILSNCGDGKPSIENGKWIRGLKEPYKTKKGEESTANFANLELHGDFLDALKVKPQDGKVLIEIADKDQLGKAEGHLTGKYGKHSEIRPREFMPHKRGDKLTKDILEGVAEILRSHAEED